VNGAQACLAAAQGEEEGEDKGRDAPPPPPGGQANDPDQDAAIRPARDAKNKGGLSAGEAEALVELGNSVGVPSNGPESHPDRPYTDPHIHVGPVDHIPVK